jgi:hypothetical protein
MSYSFEWNATSGPLLALDIIAYIIYIIDIFFILFSTEMDEYGNINRDLS